MPASCNKAKMRQSKHRSGKYVAQATRTMRNKANQKRAREKRVNIRGNAALAKRLLRREFLRTKRKEDPSYGRTNPPPDPEIIHRAVSGEARKDGLIYSCTCLPKK